MPLYKIFVVDTDSGRILAEKIQNILWEMSNTEIKCRKFRTKKWAQHKWPFISNRIEVVVYKLN